MIQNTLYHNQKLIDLLNMRAGDQKYVVKRVGFVKGPSSDRPSASAGRNIQPQALTVQSIMTKEEKILDTEINFNDRALIPDSYLPVANERLKIYRSLNDSKSNEEINKILEDLKDRCGKPNDDLLNLIENSKLRILANKVGIKKIYSNLEKAMITFNDNLNDQVYKKLIGLIQTGSAKIKLDKENKITLDVSDAENKRFAVKDLLEKLI